MAAAGAARPAQARGFPRPGKPITAPRGGTALLIGGRILFMLAA